MINVNLLKPNALTKTGAKRLLSKTLTAGLMILTVLSAPKVAADQPVFDREEGYIRIYPSRLQCASLPCTIRVPGTFVVLKFGSDASVSSNVDLVGVSLQFTRRFDTSGNPWVICDNMNLNPDDHKVATMAGDRCAWSTSSGSSYIRLNGARFLINNEIPVQNWTMAGAILDGNIGSIYNAVDVNIADLKISEDLKIPTYTLAKDFSFALDQLSAFENGMKRSDRSHLARLKQALQDALRTMVDKDGNAILPITHMKVQENARVVLVLTTVLNEIMDDYNAVPALTVPIQALQTLETEIRLSYGWDDGMAGSGSKALAAISDGLDVVLRDLYRSAAAFNAAKPEPFSAIMRANIDLNAAVRAAKGGDMHATQQVMALAAAWNSADWQAILSQLLNAPQDYRDLVQGKLKIMVEEVESIADLSGQNFTITTNLDNVRQK